MDKKFNITGMTCSACSANVERSVRKLPGVSSVNVNLLTNSMVVQYDPAVIESEQIIKAVSGAGYGASEAQPAQSAAPVGSAPSSPAGDQARIMRLRLIVSIVFSIPLIYLAMGPMLGAPLPWGFGEASNALPYALTQFLLTLPVMIVNEKYYTGGFKSLFKRAPNMDSLIALGSTAALIYGVFAVYEIGYGLGHGLSGVVEQYRASLYFDSAAMILTLVTLGKYLEARAKGKTSQALERLIDLEPKTATVLRGGAEVEVSASEVAVGDVLVVRAGQRIPADGVILDGAAAIDQSALTGESLPVEKQAGDQVIAATISKSGFFKFRAQKTGGDTAFARIIRLVEDASASKAPIARLADRISGVFVPIVICVALAAAVIWLLLGQSFEFSISIGISVLVISCPCALGLATPVAIMVGMGKGAESGILIKSAEALETAHLVDTVVLDKTGTVTEGKPIVTDIITIGGWEERGLLSIAASLETPSGHPLADAISEKAAALGIEARPVSDFELIPGRGIRAVLDGKRYFAGNLALMLDSGLDAAAFGNSADSLANEGKTPIYFAGADGPIGIIAAADVLKPTSREAVRLLESDGIGVVMLTGDNEKTAAAIGRQLGVGRVIADILPDGKEAEIRRLQESGKKVAMVGDGINDAPALVRADVGVAIGAGTDVAIESADIVLVKSDLLDAVTAVRLSRAVIRNIRQNLFWAFFYNVVGIPLAAGVFYSALGWTLSPMIGAAAMSLSSLFVVTNALRLRFFKPLRAPEAQNTVQNKIEGAVSMKKYVKIEGMSCAHCQAAIERALNAIPGVSASVDLDAKTATVIMEKEVGDDMLIEAVDRAGYKAVSVQRADGNTGGAR